MKHGKSRFQAVLARAATLNSMRDDIKKGAITVAVALANAVSGERPDLAPARRAIYQWFDQSSLKKARRADWIEWCTRARRWLHAANDMKRAAAGKVAVGYKKAARRARSADEVTPEEWRAEKQGIASAGSFAERAKLRAALDFQIKSAGEFTRKYSESLPRRAIAMQKRFLEMVHEELLDYSDVNVSTNRLSPIEFAAIGAVLLMSDTTSYEAKTTTLLLRDRFGFCANPRCPLFFFHPAGPGVQPRVCNPKGPCANRARVANFKAKKNARAAA